MNALKKDANHNLTEVRDGGIVAVYGSRPVATYVDDTWFRICPNGNDASVGTTPDTIDLQSLAGDVERVDIRGWFIKILSEGYRGRVARVIDYSGAVVTIDYGDAYHRPFTQNLPATFEYVLYPDVVKEFKLNYLSSAEDDMTVGFLNQDTFATPNGNVAWIDILSPGESICIPTAMVDRLCVLWDTVTANADNAFSWGEHLVIRPS